MFKYVAVAKILKKHKPSVDTSVLYLHYRFTFLILVVASAFITAKEYFGAPIDCYSKGGIPGDVLNIYCFIMSTFSVPRSYAKPLGDGAPAMDYKLAGLGHQQPDDEIVYHAYYQWVPLVLFFQALLFYSPRFIWKNIEGGLFNVILGGMDQPDMEESARTKKHRILSAYMIHNHNMHTFWAFRFFFCELMSLAVVVFNLYFTDFFLGGTFMTYGTDVLNFMDEDDQSLRVDPMSRVFPLVSKCNFKAHGPSGTIEVHDSMCVLAVNILNQKIYVLLWFWFVLLATLTGLHFCFRIATIVSHSVRSWMLKYRGRMAGKEYISQLQSRCNLGDWFLLDQLGRTIEPTVFGEFLRELATEMDRTPPDEKPHSMLFNS